MEGAVGISTRAAALKRKTAHKLVPGVGYVEFAAPPAGHIVGPNTPERCDPPAGARDGSRHMLRTPGGEKTLLFMWVAAEKAWERHGGLRMAFQAAYLAHHGWVYDHAATADEIAAG